MICGTARYYVSATKQNILAIAAEAEVKPSAQAEGEVTVTTGTKDLTTWREAHARGVVVCCSTLKADSYSYCG